MIDAQAPPIKSSKSLNPTNQGSDRLRRILVYLVMAVLAVLIWEGSKAIFAIPDYKLPHLSQIGAAFVRPAAKGQFVWQVLLYDAAYTMLEALTGFVIGGLVGCLVTLPLNGMTSGTQNFMMFSEVTFSFHFGPRVLLQGMLLAMAMGLLGGLAPAARAVRLSIIQALRER